MKTCLFFNVMFVNRSNKGKLKLISISMLNVSDHRDLEVVEGVASLSRREMVIVNARMENHVGSSC